MNNYIKSIKSALPVADSALFHVYFIRKKVIHIEVKIPKEIRAHRETIFFSVCLRGSLFVRCWLSVWRLASISV